MKLWKSPALYFGMLLVLAVSGGLLAPYIIDWGSYRMAIESYGSKLTGRARDGRRANLGPAVSLAEAHDRRRESGQSAGAFEPYFITAEEVDVRMTLAGLFGGHIQVETIDIVAPGCFFRAADERVRELASQTQRRSVTIAVPRPCQARSNHADRRRRPSDRQSPAPAGPPSRRSMRRSRRQDIAGPWRRARHRQPIATGRSRSPSIPELVARCAVQIRIPHPLGRRVRARLPVRRRQ